MFSLRKPSPDRLQRIVDEQGSAALSYPEVGATGSELPPGYHHDRYACRLGDGQAAFDRASEGLRRWAAHRGAHVDVYPLNSPIALDTTVVLVIGLGLLHAVAACRVVYVIDAADQFGFGYGTLPLHPERGEEAFLIERDPDGSVWFRIVAFSRPHELLARLGSPVARAIQRRVTGGYMRALQQFVRMS